MRNKGEVIQVGDFVLPFQSVVPFPPPLATLPVQFQNGLRNGKVV